MVVSDCVSDEVQLEDPVESFSVVVAVELSVFVAVCVYDVPLPPDIVAVEESDEVTVVVKIPVLSLPLWMVVVVFVSDEVPVYVPRASVPETGELSVVVSVVVEVSPPVASLPFSCVVHDSDWVSVLPPDRL